VINNIELGFSYSGWLLVGSRNSNNSMVLSVELDDNVWVYSPGQTIKGKVVLTKNIWNKVEGMSLQ